MSKPGSLIMAPDQAEEHAHLAGDGLAGLDLILRALLQVPELPADLPENISSGHPAARCYLYKSLQQW